MKKHKIDIFTLSAIIGVFIFLSITAVEGLVSTAPLYSHYYLTKSNTASAELIDNETKQDFIPPESDTEILNDADVCHETEQNSEPAVGANESENENQTETENVTDILLNTPSEQIVQTTSDAQTKTYIIANANSVMVRTAPNTAASVLGTLDKYDALPLFDRTGNWYQTVYKRQTAYVFASYFDEREFQKSSVTVESVIREAERLLGYQYVYGATRLHDGNGNKYSGFNNTKFDCSSFVQYAFYYGAEINLALTTRTQIKQGNHVDRTDIKRGDLLFFTNSSRVNNVGIERVGHVAIYLGNNYILHTASDHAVIEPITQSRWNYFIEARRIV